MKDSIKGMLKDTAELQICKDVWEQKFLTASTMAAYHQTYISKYFLIKNKNKLDYDTKKLNAYRKGVQLIKLHESNWGIDSKSLDLLYKANHETWCQLRISKNNILDQL